MKKNAKNNVFNESDDTFSDDFSVSSRRLSSSIVPNFVENDDTKEKRANRKSMLLESNNLTNINKIIELPSGYTEEQVGQHYGNCIKLASENKINSKNAFNLHLIDYLGNYVQGLQHFQTVGSSLDAGSKIYAGRVDSIHQNTYQVLTGLGNPSDEKVTEVDVDNGVPEDLINDEEMETKTKKPKRKINPNKKMICQNLKKIRINPASLRSEVDPLFQSQAENFDEGGNYELRCNNLRLLDKTFDLLLDSEKVVITNSIEEKASVSKQDNEWFDISEFKTMLVEISKGSVQFSGQFEDFMFTGWNVNNEIMNSTTAESFRNMKMEQDTKSFVKLENPEVNVPEPYYEDNFGCDDNYDNDYNHQDYHEIMKEDPVVEDEDDNIVTIGSSKADNCTGNILMSSVRGLVNSFVEHYGEMNDNMLGMWAGPLYWKQKAKPLKTFKVDTDKKNGQTQKPAKVIKPIFPEKIETYLDANGVVRTIIKHEFKFTKSDRPSTQLTDVCLNKNITKDYLLPPRRYFSYQSINNLMTREVSLINIDLKQHAKKLHCSELDDEDKVLNYDYNNANDVLEFCPRYTASLVADDQGNVTAMNNDMDVGFDDVPNDDDDYGDAYSGNSFAIANFGELLEEQPDERFTANVRHVEKIDIDYAKTAKRINVKNLKAEIWSTLKTSIKAIDMADVLTHKYPNLYQNSGRIMFSDMLRQVDQRLTGDAAKDVSVPIMLTCLLHLANETGLHMDITEDMSDIAIGQGYSDYDIQQIEIFGKGNYLVNDPRKRKSLDAATGTRQSPPRKRLNQKTKAHEIDLFEDDVESMDVEDDDDLTD